MDDTMTIHHSTIDKTGKVLSERTLPVGQCPNYIMVSEHYPEKGPCFCYDSTNKDMLEWEYTWNEKKGI